MKKKMSEYNKITINQHEIEKCKEFLEDLISTNIIKKYNNLRIKDNQIKYNVQLVKPIEYIELTYTIKESEKNKNEI